MNTDDSNEETTTATPMTAESCAELAEALRERSRQCMKLASPSGMGRMHGKAAAYAHAAELVEAQS